MVGIYRARPRADARRHRVRHRLCVIAAVAIGTCVPTLAVASNAFAWSYQDSWEANTLELDIVGTVFQDPCDQPPVGWPQYVSWNCHWQNPPWQYHNWTNSQVENLSSYGVGLYDFIATQSGGIVDEIARSGPFKNGEGFGVTANGNWSNNTSGIQWAFESGCPQSGCNVNQTIWGWEGQ